jgi:hypothetical protein
VTVEALAGLPEFERGQGHEYLHRTQQSRASLGQARRPDSMVVVEAALAVVGLVAFASASWVDHRWDIAIR